MFLLLPHIKFKTMKNQWNIKSKQLLKSELVRRDISHEQLVDYLDNIGISETKASIDSKLSRGTFSTAFFLQCLKAIGCNNISLDLYIDVKSIIQRVKEAKKFEQNTN